MSNRRLVLCLLALPLLTTALQQVIHVQFLSLSVFAVSPLVASMVFGWRGTAGWCAYVLALALPMTLLDDTFSPALDVVRLLSLSPVLALAVANSAIRVRREAHLRDVLAVSRVAQSTILRELPAVVAGVPVVARYRSAAAESRVGGDLYEVVEWSGGLRLVVGDVRGKGLDAVRTAARTVAAFRDSAEDHESLLDVVASVDRSTSRVLSDEDFVTAVFAELTDQGVLRLANCGHPAPMLVRRDGSFAELASSPPTVPLGLGPSPTVEEYRLEAGERVLFFSDGLVEARTSAGDFFPLVDGVGDLAEGNLNDGVDRLLWQLDEFSRSLSDDLVLLALESPVTAGGSARGPAAHVNLARDEHAAGRARRIVRKVLEDAGAPDLVEDTVLLTHELVINAMLHTQGAVDLTLHLHGQRLRVEVRDESPVPPVAGVLAQGATSGRGLTMVQALAADWGVAPSGAGVSGKVVWFSLERGQRSAGEPALRSEDELLDRWDDMADAAAGLDAPTHDGSASGQQGSNPRHVRLDLNSALFVSARAHIEDLLREMALVAQTAAGPDAASAAQAAHPDPALVDTARRLTGLAADLADFRTALRAQALAAESSGAPTWTLTLTLPTERRESLLHYGRALDEADRLCAEGRLLIPPKPEATAFRRWKLDRIVDQLAPGDRFSDDDGRQPRES